MSTPDLNLLIALNVLLDESSVARAARRLRLSPSAMSRTLARLRETMADPLLVRAGRGLVATPRALELREQVAQLAQDVKAVLRPAEKIDLKRVDRTFTLRVSDGFVENFGPELVDRVAREAPSIRLHFLQKTTKDSLALRNGLVDLEIGVIGDETGPEVRTRALFHDRFIGVARQGHPLSAGDITPARYGAALHVLVSRRGLDKGLVDEVLKALGLERKIVTTVDGFAAALALTRSSDLVATVPARHTKNLRIGLFSFTLPFLAPEVIVSMLWHPRMDGDQPHRWLRECIRDVCVPDSPRENPNKKR
ncbi:MAG: LysR family transcriptional regulator [Paralcaligenes sp.]